jgi:hypothetical protein
MSGPIFTFPPYAFKVCKRTKLSFNFILPKLITFGDKLGAACISEYSCNDIGVRYSTSVKFHFNKDIYVFLTRPIQQVRSMWLSRSFLTQITNNMVLNAYVKSGTNTTCVDKECIWKLRMHSQGYRSEGHTEPQTQLIQNAEPACTQINKTRLTHTCRNNLKTKNAARIHC